MWCARSYKLVDFILRDRQFARVMPAEDTDTNPAEPSAEVVYAPHLKHFAEVEQHSLLNLEPPRHTRIRSLINHAFISRQVDQLEPQVRFVAESLLKKIYPLGCGDLLIHYAMPMPAQIIAGMLGVPDQHIDNILNWSHAMVKVYTLQQNRQDELKSTVTAYRTVRSLPMQFYYSMLDMKPLCTKLATL